MTNTQFKNCYVGTEFGPYRWTDAGNEVKNKSYFKNCEFITDDIIKGNIAPKAGIILHNNYGIDILGCDFINEALDSSDPELIAFYWGPQRRGKGIISMDSYFECRKKCTGFNNGECTGYDYGQFINLIEK